ncbi:MAG: hypothetical protein RSD49_12030 [Hafnia sp.]
MKPHVANLFRRALMHAKNGGFAVDMLNFQVAADKGIAGRELFRRAIYICREECDKETAERLEQELNALPVLPEDEVKIAINCELVPQALVMCLIKTLEKAAEHALPDSPDKHSLDALLDMIKGSRAY